ncbi:helix-turn-helix transcriptional regulator [Picosynechococcus sp. PCC 8807]|uniref:helix-turn-helix transcriptional regulator n=1 Tax=Picosynechococcus sp. PCC 8807 TaxID=195248 RepID=UPI000810DFEF|nr:hypothetical protein AWQ24_09150 [Picosynechococcus sp. PCC 8807]
MGVKECNQEITLKVLRRKLNMNQSQFAQALGVRRETVSQWERGVYKPSLSIDQIKRLQDLLTQVDLTFKDLPDDLAS